MFFSDPIGNFSRSYDQLVDDILAESIALEGPGSTSLVYGSIVFWLGKILRNEPQVRFSDFKEAEALRYATPMPASVAKALRQCVPLDSNDELERLAAWRQLFLNSRSQIVLESSGTTGKPKEVWHTLETMKRGLNLSPAHRGDVWGLSYPVDHLGGIQVLLQALFNGNHLVNLYRADFSEVHHALAFWSITHLSCTPTFLRMLLADSSVHPGLVRLTNGGERYDVLLDGAIKKMFPNSRRRNIYASTEVGPLLFSDNDVFEIPVNLLDSVKIINGELWFHNRLKVDHHEDAASNASQDGDGHPDFWPTGDQVEVIGEAPLRIRFLSRNSEGFNVGGFRVDPVRLETIARQHPNVAQARIYGIPNSVTENLVGCDLVAAPETGPIETGEWQAWFRQKVERHEVPRIVRWVDQIATTKSGKVKRV